MNEFSIGKARTNTYIFGIGPKQPSPSKRRSRVANLTNRQFIQAAE